MTCSVEGGTRVSMWIYACARVCSCRKGFQHMLMGIVPTTISFESLRKIVCQSNIAYSEKFTHTHFLEATSVSLLSVWYSKKESPTWDYMCKRFVKANACEGQWGVSQRSRGEQLDGNADLSPVKERDERKRGLRLWHSSNLDQADGEFLTQSPVRSHASPRNGSALVSLLHLVTGWHQPLGSVALVPMQWWISEHSS